METTWARSVDFHEPGWLLGRVLQLRDTESANRVALSGPCADGDTTTISYGHLASAVAAAAASLPVREGDRVALVGPNGPAWVTAFLGVLSRGSVAVPLDRNLATNELASLLADADPAVVCVGAGDDARVQAALEAAEITPRIQPMSMAETSDSPVSPVPREPEDPAVIAYTGGTMGMPKGVTIAWANLCYQVDTLVRFGRFSSDSSFVSVLPAHHMLELVAGTLSPLYVGGSVHYPRSLLPADIVATVAERRATHLVCVPLLLTALRRRIESEFALESVHSHLGGRLHTFVVGGAPLDPELGDYFERLGFHICQGYGMTEASPVVSVNTPWQNRPGSTGRLLPGTEVRVDDGEILVRGPGVMSGYWRQPDLTNATIDDEGWLHTGDKGFVDGDGYLYVTGRTKNLIVLANGENVQPIEVETVIQRSDLVGEVCVLSGPGPHGEEIVAVVTPNEQARTSFADGAAREQAIVGEVRRVSAELAQHKRPNRIVVHESELPRTPTRNVRRGEVQENLHLLEGVVVDG